MISRKSLNDSETSLTGAIDNSDLTEDALKYIEDDLKNKTSNANSLINVVHTAINDKSSRALSILVNIHEIHSKKLFDIFHNEIRSSNKLEILRILSELAGRKPPWLHRISDTPLLKELIKCLKTDNDVLVLVSGIHFLAFLLAVIPFLIRIHLSEIFDVFFRISTFYISKTGDEHTDPLLMHLHISVYSLFHRLYAMYPCNFIHFLKRTYEKKENRQTFDSVIKPMLAFVRMHPLLITSDPQLEIAKERWRDKGEVHDIVVECEKLSLDSIEGCSKEYLYSVRGCKNCCNNSDTLSLKNAAFELSNQIQGKENESVINQSLIINLYTPPIGSANSSRPSSQIESSLNTPSYLTPHESPLNSEEFNKNSNTSDVNLLTSTSHSSSLLISAASPQKSIDVSSFTNANYENLICSHNSTASPLNPDLTNDPPRNSQNLQAVRKISFEQTNDGEPEQAIEAIEEVQNYAQNTNALHIATPKSSNGCENFSKSAPMVFHLSSLISSLDESCDVLNSQEIDTEESSTNDDEIIDKKNVEETSLSSTSQDSKHMVNTENIMKEYRKNTNRKRFDSISRNFNILKNNERSKRVRSCPNFENIIDSLPSTDDDSSKSKRNLSDVSAEKNSEKSSELIHNRHRINDSLMASSILSSIDSSLDFQHNNILNSDLTYRDGSDSGIYKDSASRNSFATINAENISRFLPQDHSSSFSSSISPHELLDRYIDCGRKRHANNTDGSSSSPGDINTLKGEIQLLHVQLMFERHKRELHSERNRRLLGRITKSVALEEEKKTMDEKIIMMENEVSLLNGVLKSESYAKSTLKREKDEIEHKYEISEKSLLNKNKRLEAEIKDLGIQLAGESKSKRETESKLQKSEAKLFEMNEQLETFEKMANTSDNLKIQVTELNKELLLMGELQQRYQQRLATLSFNNATPEATYALESCQKELEDYKKYVCTCERTNSSLEARVKELEKRIVEKDDVTNQAKKQIENMKGYFAAKDEALVKKYETLKSVHMALQTEILKLNADVANLERQTHAEANRALSRTDCTSSSETQTTQSLGFMQSFDSAERELGLKISFEETFSGDESSRIENLSNYTSHGSSFLELTTENENL